jgi:hypothetical protein
MAAPTHMAVPTLHSLGDLSNDDDQMIIILHAVQFCNAHGAISRSQVGVSFCFVLFLIAILLIVIYDFYKPNLFIIIIIFIHQAQWGLVMVDLFLNYKLLSFFKRPSNMYDLKKKVLLAMKSRYRKVTDRGAHSDNVVVVVVVVG